MAAELTLAPEVEQDVSDAYDWYDSDGLGSAESFSVASTRAFSIYAVRRICTPRFTKTIDGPWFGDFPMPFPYAVFFEYSGPTVTVYCVFHTSRNPDKWCERLP